MLIKYGTSVVENINIFGEHGKSYKIYFSYSNIYFFSYVLIRLLRSSRMIKMVLILCSH